MKKRVVAKKVKLKGHKYKVFFDTNILRDLKSQKDIDQLSVSDFKRYLNQNKIKSVGLYVTEANVLELIQQRMDNVQSSVNKINIGYEQLSKILLKKTNIRINNLRKKVTDEIKAKISELDIQEIKTPHLNIDDLMNDAIEGIRPFRPRTDDARSDTGFKDMVIWRTALSSIKEKEHLIFVTENKNDFVQAELEDGFNKYCKESSFCVLNGLVELKEFLNSIYAEDIKYVEDVKKVSEIAKTGIGEIMLYLHKQLTDSKDGSPYAKYGSGSAGGSPFRSVLRMYPNEDDVVGYGFESMLLQDVLKVPDKQMYTVRLAVSVKLFKKEERDDAVWRVGQRYSSTNWLDINLLNSKTFFLKLKVDIAKGILRDIKSAY